MLSVSSDSVYTIAKKMTASSIATVDVNNGETAFFKDIDSYIDALNERLRNKCRIKKQIYNDTVKCLSLSKGKPDDLSLKFTCWATKKFALTKIADVDVGCFITSKKPICVYGVYYNALGEAHLALSHGGRHQTVSEYSWSGVFHVKRQRQSNTTLFPSQ